MNKDSSHNETTYTNPVKFNKGIEELKKFEHSGDHVSNIDEYSQRINFLCGPGVFDWSESRLMYDVKNNNKDFKVLSNNGQNAYNELQVYGLIERINLNQKISQSEIPVMFKTSFATLAELMTYMNQHANFPMIAQKYK